MILALDVGNTQTVFGCFIDGRLARSWRIATDPRRTADEYWQSIGTFLTQDGRNIAELSQILVSSVVPPVTRDLAGLARAVPVFVADHRSVYGFENRTRHPETVGPDRLVNAEAALRLHGAPVVIVDCGTATTFCVLNRARQYLGGAIAPGIAISTEALFARASRLAQVELSPPSRAIGDTTESCLCSGVLFGYASLVDGMVARLRDELDEPGVRAIGTGGWMTMLAPLCKTLDFVEPDLTLQGLYWVWEATRESMR